MLVKASYFPNWAVSGGKGPYRVTPNQMVVIPTSKHVSLHYQNTPVDWLGWFVTFLGVIGLVVLVRAGRVVYPDPRARAQPFLPWGPGQPGQPVQLGQPPPPDVPYYAYLDGQLQGVDPGDYWDDPVPNGRASSPN